LNCQGALAASVLGKIYGIPVVNRFHGTDVTEKNLQTLKDRMILLDQISGLKSGCNAVIMTNDGTKGDVILRALGIDRSRIRFWMNGIDRDDLHVPAASEVENLRSDLGLQGKRVLLMISRLAVWKRIDRGIYCLSEMRKLPGYDDLHLVIVGQGPERENLENYAKSLGVSSCVHFIGKVPHHSISAYYLLADVFLSLYDRSNLGNPLLEALFFGCPMVTISDGSADHLLEDGENAFLVSQSEIETELPRKVKMILDDTTLQAGFRRKATATFQDELVDWKERMLKEHEFIQEVIASSKGI
jgi:glycosyltransferase involved in cell wall biosynthesis